MLSKKTIIPFRKNIALISTLAIVLNLFVPSAFLVSKPLTHAEIPGMCSAPVDVVLIMDRSGSMGYTSRCDWWQLKCVDSPTCTSYNWVLNTTYDQTKSWCDAKTQSAPHQSVWTEYNPTKIEAAQDAAKSFLDSMGDNDQSALVSFATNVTLDKGLSNDHLQTKTAIDNMVVVGATNIGDAISLGFQELNSVRSKPQAVKAMILLTDGKANKPNGSGSGENATDVAYAISKANEAAALNYKIFTVGLGSDGEINETMLQQIASITGANYHHAPNGSDLSDIYNQIAWEVCQYGSIAGCVYNDQNNNGAIDSGEPTLNNWEITLTNGATNQTQTSIGGCYTFAGLEDDTYTISEIVPNGWLQTYPTNGAHSITISGHNTINNIDFANYQPLCGNQILDANEICELGDTQICTADSGLGGLQSCNDSCSGWGACVVAETCGDNIKNGTEECDGQDGIDEHHFCNSNCILEYIPYCGDGIINQTTEMCDNDIPITCTTDIGYAGTSSCNNECDWDICQPTEFCGDGVKNGPELCDGSDGVGANQSCSKTCSLINLPYCGDGIINQASEQCDDSNNLDGDGCSATCQTETPPTCTSSIAGKKYNGNQENSVFLQNWQIELYNDDQVLITTATTNTEGRYVFENLCAGTYILKEVQQTGWQQIFPVDENKKPIFYTDTITNENTKLNNRDFSNIQTSSITGFVYNDADGLTTTTTDRSGLNNWLVNLFVGTATTTLATTSTNSAGHFEFNNLLPDSYNLTQILLTNWTQISTPATITLAANTTSADNNFVNYYTGGSGGDDAVCGNNIKESEEACDGTDGLTVGYHCTDICTLEADTPPTGGGGGPTANVCNDGILNNQTEECDGIFGTPAGYTCTNTCKLQKNNLTTPSTGDTNTNDNTSGGSTNLPTPEDNNRPGKIGSGIAIIAPTVAGEYVKEEPQKLPQVPTEMVFGAETTCPLCGWLNWLIVALLALVNCALYYYIYRQRLNNDEINNKKI